MTAPYLGGFAITGSWWEGATALRIAFETTYDTAYQYQVYVNRVLSGFTDSTTDREILCNCEPSAWPQEITLLAVDPAEVATDYGDDLPPRPYNQVKLTINNPGTWTDTDRIEITSSTVPGGSLDPENIIGVIPYDVDRPYDFVSQALQGGGDWAFGATPVDKTKPDGNKGDTATATVTIDAHPPDLIPQPDGLRFSVSVTGGNLILGFTEAI